jgi:glycosyltransferase involved in cell wall biosynthesis
VLACARLRAAGREAIPIVSSYTTYASESRSLLRFAAPYGWRPWLRYGAAHLWIRLAVAGWERRAYCESERVLLNYESVRSLVAASYGAAARCVKLTYAAEAAFLCEGPACASGVEIGSERAPRLAEAGAPPLIAAVSRHDPRKGWDVLLGALDRLRRQGVPYRACLAGGGPQLAADRALARRLGLGGGSVEILGEVPDPFALLRRADVFVLPSRAEQSGSLSLLEALQAGCAVVASRVDGIPEDVADGASALLVEPGDPAALAGALARLLGDAGLRRRLGTAARKLFEERFSAAAFAAALGRVYAELGVVAEAQEPPRSEGARAGGSR